MTTQEMLSGLNAFRDEVHANAVEHGFYDPPPTLPEAIALMHSELSEALEEYRAGNPIIYPKHGKLEGVGAELADVIIRALDYCGHLGIDIAKVMAEKHEYNKTRPYMHGKVC